MSKGFDDTSSHSLADVMDKKPEEKLREQLKNFIEDLRIEAKEEQEEEVPRSPHYSYCNGILKTCRSIEKEFDL